MLETMYAENGIGLAAVQVGQLKRLLVMDVPAEEENEEEGRGEGSVNRRVVVNPEILEQSGEVVTEEGCLSVLDFTAEVTRAERVVVKYQNLKGESITEELDSLEAVCIQHEMDHLAGKLFIDYLPPLKRQMIKKRLAKISS